MQPTSRYVTCENREIHFLDWGSGEVVFCVHGLARTGRDFDPFAAALCDRYRLIAIDWLGRGFSQWSPDPASEYAMDFYGRLARAFLDEIGVERVRWVGTSMGGAIGMHAAAGALADRISHLVLNDIGPQLEPAAVDRIKTYVGNPPDFATLTEFELYLRTIYQPFGDLGDAEWRRMAETSARRRDDGRITVHYDPNIAMQFSGRPADYDLWADYDRVTAPTLLLRGANSDLLSQAVAEEMTRRGPRARLSIIDGCGHAPTLGVAAQISLVADFLAS